MGSYFRELVLAQSVFHQDKLLTFIAYLLQYATEIVLGLMLIQSVLLMRKRAVLKRRWFGLILPITCFLIFLVPLVYHPITITSPKSGVIVHPGDSLPITVELHPTFLSALYPSVGVEMPRCWDCLEGAQGVLVEGVLAGSPYQFTMHLPKTLRSGVLATSATAGVTASRPQAMHSANIELVVAGGEPAAAEEPRGFFGQRFFPQIVIMWLPLILILGLWLYFARKMAASK